MKFVLDSENLSGLALDSLKRLIQQAKWSHTADVVLRCNGEDQRFEADWIKYLKEFE